MTLGTWIKVKFGTHNKLNETLGLGKNTINRWYNSDPKRFFMYLPQLSKWSDTEPNDLLSMIEERIEDVEALRN
jgi:hypothetical protein|tara:strand:- start:877 stop:1098 length:222 start_codon:yes stop_codon:yes gene_type:complete